MASASDFKTRQVGALNTLDYRVYLENTKTGLPASPFHDVPLFANEDKTILNFFVEIPRWTNAKQEISKEEAFNPVKQDTKKGKLRFVRNCFPHHGYIWNYGAFPQVSKAWGWQRKTASAKLTNSPPFLAPDMGRPIPHPPRHQGQGRR